MRKLPKLIFTDIDGVWTDGGMYYDQTGNEWKRFDTSDSWGVAFCMAFGIDVVIITSENTEIVKRRAAKLKIENCYIGVKNKLLTASQHLAERNISWEDVAYIGDDLNDFQVLSVAGFTGCPSNAPNYIKQMVKFVGKKRGGDGAFREFVEHIITKFYTVEEMISRVLPK